MLITISSLSIPSHFQWRRRNPDLSSVISYEKFVRREDWGRASYIVLFPCSDQATQLKRLMERNNFTQSDAEQRINAQMSLDEKCRRASYVIDNSSNRETTAEQVKRLHDKFTRSYAYLPLRIIGLLIVGLITWLFIFLVRLVR